MATPASSRYRRAVIREGLPRRPRALQRTVDVLLPARVTLSADGYPVEDGYVRLPDAPGIGLELKASLAPVLAELST